VEPNLKWDSLVTIISCNSMRFSFVRSFGIKLGMIWRLLDLCDQYQSYHVPFYFVHTSRFRQLAIFSLLDPDKGHKINFSLMASRGSDDLSPIRPRSTGTAGTFAGSNIVIQTRQTHRHSQEFNFRLAATEKYLCLLSPDHSGLSSQRISLKL
jgi:hypothetical protein